MEIICNNYDDFKIVFNNRLKYKKIIIDFEFKESSMFQIFNSWWLALEKTRFIFNKYQKIHSINYAKWLYFCNCDFKKWLKFSGCTFWWQFAFAKSKCLKELIFEMCIFQNDFYMFSNNIKHLNISWGSFSKNLMIDWRKWDIKTFTLWWCKFKDKNNSDVLLLDIKTDTMLIEWFYNDCHDFSINWWVFWGLRIESSDLWRLKFNGVNIQKLSLENATLNDCIFNWCSFPKDYKIEDIPELNTKWENDVNYKKMKDNYRQLKHVMDKNGNHTEANKFYAKEMEYYEKTLGIEKKWLWSTLIEILKTIWFWWENKKRWEKLSLLFSDSITEHWTNLTRWLFVLFVFAFLSTNISLWYLITWITSCEAIFKYFIDQCNSRASLNIMWTILTIFMWIVLILSVIQDSKQKILRETKLQNIIKWIQNIIKWDYILLSFLLIIFILLSFSGGIIYFIEWDRYTFIPLRHFINLLDPTYWLVKNQISNYSTIEIIFFVIYKILYGVILWHVLVAARRTTRR